MRRTTLQSIGWAAVAALVSAAAVFRVLTTNKAGGESPGCPPPACPELDCPPLPPPPPPPPPPAWVGSNKAAVLYLDHGWGGPALRPVVGLVVGNVLGLLSDEWAVQVHILGAADAFPAALNARYKGALASGRLTVVDLAAAANGSRAGYLNGKVAAYTDTAWWGLIPAEHVLNLHPTLVPGVLCSGGDHAIDEFLEYDFVGAPWKLTTEGGWAQPGSAFSHGGNGAISLRRKSAMLKVLAEHTYHNEKNEDMWFIERMVEHNKAASAGATKFTLNDREVGRTFSVEELFYPSPVCVSYALRKISKVEREAVLANCPEARALAGYLPGADWLAHPEQSPPSRCIGKTPPEPCPWP